MAYEWNRHCLHLYLHLYSSTDHFPGPEAAIISNPPMMPMFFKNCVCMPPAVMPWAAQKLCSSTLTTPRLEKHDECRCASLPPHDEAKHSCGLDHQRNSQHRGYQLPRQLV
jgi:hypothetical protein